MATLTLASNRASLYASVVRLFRIAWARALREPTPVIDPLQPEKRDRMGLGPIRLL